MKWLLDQNKMEVTVAWSLGRLVAWSHCLLRKQPVATFCRYYPVRTSKERWLKLEGCISKQRSIDEQAKMLARRLSTANDLAIRDDEDVETS